MGITISIVLMVSVSMFVSNGIKNITLQEQVLHTGGEVLDFSRSLSSVFDHLDTSVDPVLFASGVLVKTQSSLGHGVFEYL